MIVLNDNKKEQFVAKIFERSQRGEIQWKQVAKTKYKKYLAENQLLLSAYETELGDNRTLALVELKRRSNTEIDKYNRSDTYILFLINNSVEDVYVELILDNDVISSALLEVLFKTVSSSVNKTEEFLESFIK